jgi:hypothetical protein
MGKSGCCLEGELVLYWCREKSVSRVKAATHPTSAISVSINQNYILRERDLGSNLKMSLSSCLGKVVLLVGKPDWAESVRWVSPSPAQSGC